MILRFRTLAHRAIVAAVLATVVGGALPAGAQTAQGSDGAPVVAVPDIAAVEPWLADALVDLPVDGEILVMVGADSATSAKAAILDAGATPFRTFTKIGFSSALLTQAQIDQVRNAPGVKYLQGGERPLDLEQDTATVATRVQQAEELYTGPGGEPLDGTGIGIAVVDSGMAGDHPMYRDAADTGTRLLNIKQACVVVTACATPGEVEDTYFTDATGTDTDVLATGGHGTHVTGIAGGIEITTSNGATTRGVATNSSLYGLGAGAGVFVINASASLNWVLEHHADPCAPFPIAPAVVGGCHPIKVVNNSFGSTGDYDPNDVFSVLSEMLVLEGVVVVWAAGNGPDLTETDPPPNDGTVNLVNPPSQSPLPGVLSVANYNDGDAGVRNGSLNSSSSRGERGRPETYPDISAPGTNILSSCRPWLPICTSAYPDPNYGEISGTSMAAPHVAGIVALLLQAFPDLTPAQIEDLIEDTAHQFGDVASYEDDVATDGAPYPNQVRNGNHQTHFARGHGLIDLAAAISEQAGLPEPPFTGVCPEPVSFAEDPAGDATAAVVETPLPPEASDANFDIVGVGIELVEADGVVRFAVDVNDLADTVSASTGEFIRFAFTWESFSGQIQMARDIEGAEPETFRLVQVLGVGDTVVIADGLSGVFDPVEDVVYADLPLDVLVDNSAVDSPPTTPFGPGDLFSGVEVTMQRQVSTSISGGATITADVASGTCPFGLRADDPDPVVPEVPYPVVFVLAGGLAALALGRRRRVLATGMAALVVVGLVAAGSTAVTATPAGAVTADGLVFSDRDSIDERTVTVADANAEYSCVSTTDGVSTVEDGPGCYVVPVEMAMPDGLPLQYLRITGRPTGETADSHDIDVYLLDAETGEQLASAASSSLPAAGSLIEVAFRSVPTNGSFVVAVSSYQNLPGATYDLTIEGFGREPFID